MIISRNPAPVAVGQPNIRTARRFEAGVVGSRLVADPIDSVEQQLTRTLYHQLGQFYADLDEENTLIARPKRKSDTVEDAKNKELFLKDVTEISNDDSRMYQISLDAGSIRNKIRIWTDSGAQKVGKIQDIIGVSARTYNAFMRGNGPKAVRESRTYERAGTFFREG